MVGNIKQPLPPWDEVEAVREKRGLCRGQRGGLPPAECFYEVLWAGSGFIWKSWSWRTKREGEKKVTALWKDNRRVLRTRGESCARDVVIGFEMLHGLSCRRQVMGNDGNKMLTYPWQRHGFNVTRKAEIIQPAIYIWLLYVGDRAVARVLSSLPT